MEEQYNRVWAYLASYRTQKMKLKRLQRQRDEFISLRGKTSELGTVVQSGRTSDSTCESALRILDNAEEIERKMKEIIEFLIEITRYIETAPVSEVEKLILTCKFIRCMKNSEICEEVGQDNASGAMHKRIRRIVRKLPEPQMKRRL